MKSITKQLLSQNVDKWEAKQKLTIYPQQVIDYLRFLIRHPEFEYNQTYQPFYIYNQTDYYIYNKMYIRD